MHKLPFHERCSVAPMILILYRRIYEQPLPLWYGEATTLVGTVTTNSGHLQLKRCKRFVCLVMEWPELGKAGLTESISQPTHAIRG